MSEKDELMYKCIRCGRDTSYKELEMRGGRIKCSHCGYRVLQKKRPPIVRRIKTD